LTIRVRSKGKSFESAIEFFYESFKISKFITHEVNDRLFITCYITYQKLKEINNKLKNFYDNILITTNFEFEFLTVFDNKNNSEVEFKNLNLYIKTGGILGSSSFKETKFWFIDNPILLVIFIIYYIITLYSIQYFIH
jgi:hypothetical protein